MSAQAVAALDAKPAKGQDKGSKSAKGLANRRLRARAWWWQTTARGIPCGPMTLSAVASRYGVSVQDLQKQNGIADPHEGARGHGVAGSRYTSSSRPHARVGAAFARETAELERFAAERAGRPVGRLAPWEIG